MSRAGFDEALLTSHASGLRALALSILRDPHAADDVLQDAYARALVAPAPTDAGLAGWLRTVVRGLARNRARDDALRGAHEARSARERETVTALTDAARAETLRAVVDAVLALDEPYRKTILARYFDDLAPAAIAARDGIPVATVATRLKRARVQLRATLEPRLAPQRGGLAGALALVAGVDRSAALASASPVASFAGAALVNAKKLALVAALAAALLVVWWLVQSVETPPDEVASQPAPVDVDRGDSAHTSAGSNSVAPRDGDGVRAALAESLAPSASSRADAEALFALPAPEPGRGPYLFRLSVDALDRDGHPLAGAVVAAAPRGVPLNELGITDVLGRLEREWRGFEPKLELALAIQSAGEGVSPFVHVVLTPGQPEYVRLALHAPELAAAESGELETQIQDELSRAFGADDLPPGARDRILDRIERDDVPPEQRRAVVRALAKRESTRASDRRAAPRALPLFALDAEENGVFADPYLFVRPGTEPASDPRTRSDEMRARATARTLAFEPGEIAELRATRRARGASRSEVAENVPELVDLDVLLSSAPGAPARGVPVTVALATQRVRLYVHTDEHGRAAFRVPAHGAAHVFVGGAGWPRFAESVRCEGAPVTIERLVPRTDVTAVRLTGGEPGVLAGWTIEAYPPEHPLQLAAHGLTDVHGLAELALPDAGPWRLLARHGDAAVELAALLNPAAWLGPGENGFGVPPGVSHGSVRVGFAAATGKPLAEADARLWDADTGQGLALGDASDGATVARARRTFASPGIRAGVYVLEAGGPGQRWASFGEVRVPEDGALDLGLVPFRDAAALELDSSVFKTRTLVSIDVVTRRAGVIVRAFPVETSVPASFLLAPGACTIELGYNATLAPLGAQGDAAKPVARHWTETHTLDVAPGSTQRIAVGDARQ